MTEIQKTIQEALEAARRIQKRRIVLLFFAILLLVLVFTAAVDRVVMFSGWERWIGWVCGLAFAVGIVKRFGKITSLDANGLAHQVEKDAKETAPVVATAIDPAVREGKSDAAGSVLLERLDQRAAETLNSAPPSFSHWLKVPLVLTTVAVLFGIAVVGLQGSLGLKRILVPWSTSPYTSIALAGPTEPLPEGKAFILKAVVTGIPVEEIALYREGNSTPVSQGTANENGELTLTVEALDEPATFVARGGDGESDPLEINPYLLPRIDDFEIEVTTPEYAGSTNSVSTEPSFSTIRGSNIRYQIRLRAPAASVSLEKAASPREDEYASEEERRRSRSPSPEEPRQSSPVFRSISPDSLVWEAPFELTDAGEILYRLVIKGEHGDQIRNEEPWRISVLDDQPPEIKITSHNGDEVIKRGDETVAFQLRAVDDVGVDKVWLVFRKPGQQQIRQQVKSPSETGMTWTGEALLDLAPLSLKPFDIIAVHAEVVDGNTIDGPGIGRSEVVFLEVPLPESPNDGGGGGGGGGSPPINPLELQMEILRMTIVMPDDAPKKDRMALGFDQRQNEDFTRQMEAAVRGEGLTELADALAAAKQQMKLGYGYIEKVRASSALPHVEAALGHLIEAAKLLQEAGGQLPPPQGGMEGMTFTLSNPRPATSDSSDESESEESSEGGEGMSEAEKEALASLMEELKRQLGEQQALNESQSSSKSESGQPSQGEGQQQSAAQEALAADARSAAAEARGLPSSSDNKGGARAAAEELERAAGLQEKNADALAEGNGEASSELGAESAEALREALIELASQLDRGNFNTDAQSPGFERLVNDYLRAISYE